MDTLTDIYRYTYPNAVDGQTEDISGHMVDQTGSVIDPDGLALCHKGIDSKKGVLLDVVGVFYYLAAPGIWGGSTETSRGIEEALHEFDQRYNGAGMPNFKLRQAYCWWIDNFLGTVEDNYGAWVDSEVWNKLGDDKLNTALTAADTQWARTDLKGNGGASRSKFKFPRDASGGGIYNA
ncbi:hypothetical protein M436DRAFT_81439 [Aureobasidium namibiae CBS 147.97]|uniref:Uncharacterized protein n=1 Tax=Aureobasidium namibiae CBS 147.97 TaxID=1043004 RepID=A0A074WWA6_9PEZI